MKCLAMISSPVTQATPKVQGLFQKDSRGWTRVSTAILCLLDTKDRIYP